MGKSDKTRCPECRKEFMHGRNLIQHRRVAHLGVRYYCEDCTNSYTRQYNLTHHRIKSHPEKVPEQERQQFERQQKKKLQHVASSSKLRLKSKAVTFNTQQQYLSQLAATATQRARYRKPIVVRQFVRSLPTTNRQNQATTSINGVNMQPSPHASPSRFVRRIISDGATNGKVGVTMAPRTTLLSMVKSPAITASAGPTATANIVSKPLLLPITPQRLHVTSMIAKANIHRCQLCPFSTTNSDGLKHHRLKHSSNLAQRHRCSFCSYSVDSTPSLVMMHTAVHFSATSIPAAAGVIEALPTLIDAPCTFCGRLFTSVEDLSDHERLHTV